MQARCRFLESLVAALSELMGNTKPTPSSKSPKATWNKSSEISDELDEDAGQVLCIYIPPIATPCK